MDTSSLVAALAPAFAAGFALQRLLEILDPILEKLASGKDRKSTRLNSSHSQISYAVFCLKKKHEHESGARIDSNAPVALEAELERLVLVVFGIRRLPVGVRLPAVNHAVLDCVPVALEHAT